jgi:hypothetical protein
VRFGDDLVNRADPSMEIEEIVALTEAVRRYLRRTLRELDSLGE